MRKRMSKSVTAGLLVAAMISGSVLSWMPARETEAAQRVEPVETENSYVVTIKNEKMFEDILEFPMEENLETLAEEGVLVSDMTEEEAEKLERDSRVLAVEENFVLEGSRNTNRKKESVYIEKKSQGKDLAGRDTKYISAGQDDNWNLEMIHAADADDAKIENKERVRVAVLDSGMDILDNIDVKERVNLIPGQEDFTVMFEDEAGHGTAVAGIIAGETMAGETAEGINRNVELYSVKVLDENNQAPLSRIIEGIYWAIEKNVHIINMSFGCSRYSKALEDAVKAATDKGILIIAAAGNQGESGMDTVEYPAAFPEVVAVGSVDAQGEVSDFSAKGEEMELVAPGEAVRVTGAFGADMVVSGTSMAAPHVTAVASLLWGKDLTKSAEFIRILLDESARDLGSETEAGYGLIDYAYAQKVYDRVEDQMGNGKEVSVPENDTKVQVFDNSGDVERLEESEQEKEDGEVKGSWKAAQHLAYLNQNNINLPAMKKGATYPDTENADSVGMKGMKVNPEFHGYFEDEEGNSINYVASYRYMIKLARAYGEGKTYTAVTNSDIKGLSKKSYNRIRGYIVKLSNKDFFKNYSKLEKEAFLFGVAAHTLTDTFAHSSYRKYNGKWVHITHVVNKDKGQTKEDKTADYITYIPERWDMAFRCERNNYYRYLDKRTNVPIAHDFHAAHDVDKFYPSNPTFKIKQLKTNAEKAGVTSSTVIKHYGIINQK